MDKLRLKEFLIEISIQIAIKVLSLIVQQHLFQLFLQSRQVVGNKGKRRIGNQMQEQTSLPSKLKNHQS
jgi:hypothetical protein